MKYSNSALKAGMRTLALLFPVWGIALPTTLVLFIVLLLKLPSNIPLLSSLVIILLLVAAIAVSALLAFICDDDEIRVSKDGLRFPVRFLPGLKFRNQRLWQNLAAMKLHWNRNEKFADDETVSFVFDDGGVATLQLKNLQREELEQFFIAFEACAYKCERDTDVPDFERFLQAKRPDALYSYTELWEKSLSDKFSGATFSPLEPNTFLNGGRLQILRQLSFGGFSAVYLARQSGGSFVVVKESSFPQTDDVQSKASELFQREHALLTKLDHANIAKVHDYFVESMRHYMVMEHITGIDLNRLVMQSGPQSAENVRNWLIQVASALNFIHTMSPPMVHRDVTPDNLLLKPDGTLVLIDFGAAKEIVENFTGTIIGKQAFIAPEQFRGKPTPKSDIYALGATTYFLLTGQLPEALSTSKPSSIAQNIPADLDELVERCTEQDQQERPSSADIVAQFAPKVLTEAVAVE